MDQNHSAAIDNELFRLLDTSYARFVGRSLAPSNTDAAAWLYREAPFAVLAHDTSSDPRFIYANETAQRCFEYSWNELIGMHSRLSAQEPAQAERQRLLDTVTRNGFATDYRGVRVAKSGRRFWILDGTVWQLYDENGVRRGQAAMFTKWQDL
jgi:PAS domain S-box-containing protein